MVGSTSKCDNVNAILPNINGQFVGLFDSDHLPLPHSFEIAWRDLCRGVDVVQGRTKINPKYCEDVLSKVLAGEFEVCTREMVIHHCGIAAGVTRLGNSGLACRIHTRVPPGDVRQFHLLHSKAISTSYVPLNKPCHKLIKRFKGCKGRLKDTRNRYRIWYTEKLSR